MLLNAEQTYSHLYFTLELMTELMFSVTFSADESVA